jgi:hypothetical protein
MAAMRSRTASFIAVPPFTGEVFVLLLSILEMGTA